MNKICWISLLLIVMGSGLLAQKEYKYSGKVLDATTAEPLIFANVLVKGTTHGTTTDLDGYFSITLLDSVATLEFSYTGYERLTEKAVKGGVVSNYYLNHENARLEEVVVSGISRVKKSMKRHAGAVMDAISPIVHSTPAHESVDNYNTEDYDLIKENRFYEAEQTPLSTFSIDVDAASYSNMRRFINMGQKPPKDAIRIEEMVNYFNYEYPQPKDDVPFAVVTEVSECPWATDHQLLHIGLQGEKIPMDELPASNLVFLIDVSGSMSAANKLPLLQSAFKILTDQLRDEDRVSIVVYAGAAGVVLEPTSGANKIKIKDAIHQLQAGGSTAGGEGIKLAYKIARQNFVKEGNNRVILATDGDFNIGESSDAALVRMIEKERESGVFLTVLGFGMGNYKDNKMQKLADSGNGNHAYIDNLKEARKVLVNEFGGTMFTIAKDVKIQLEFNPANVKGYRLIGYENRLLDKEDFNDDQKDAGELGSGHTVTALYEIIPQGVESPYLADVDQLKYQQNELPKKYVNSEELLTVKLRYKAPQGNKSKKIETVVKAKDMDKKASENFRWAAAVAEFGMLLRDSEFKGNASYQQAVTLAKSAQGADPNGYRRELIDMIENMAALDQDLEVQK